MKINYTGFLEDFIHSLVYMPVGMICYASYKYMFSEAVVWRKLVGAGIWSVPVGYTVSETGYHVFSYLASGFAGAFIALFLMGVKNIMEKWAKDPVEVIKEVKGKKEK